MNFRRYVIIAELNRLKSQDVKLKKTFKVFLKETIPYGKVLKFCSESFHRNTGRRVVFKFREIWPMGSR